jgi:hypothetical protein
MLSIGLLRVGKAGSSGPSRSPDPLGLSGPRGQKTHLINTDWMGHTAGEGRVLNRPANEPLHLGPTSAIEQGSFCPIDYRQSIRRSVAVWSSGSTVVVVALALYFIHSEPAIRAYSPSFDLWFSLFFVGMLLGGFSQIPLMLFQYRVPKLVAPSVAGLKMRYVGILGLREVMTPWTKVVSVELGHKPKSSDRDRFWFTFVPGGAKWYSNTFAVEPVLIESWLPHLPESVRTSMKVPPANFPRVSLGQQLQ